MRFENSFVVEAPSEEVWEALLDVERVAPCMPGAEVLERTGEDTYKVGIKVKLGPISMQYRGEVEIVERDPVTRTAVMSAKAKETRGQGFANATIHMSLSGNGELDRGQDRDRRATQRQGGGDGPGRDCGRLGDPRRQVRRQPGADALGLRGAGAHDGAGTSPAPARPRPSRASPSELSRRAS